MSEIIIFREVEEKALSNLENLVLFGESNFISSGIGEYDLIFHAKQTNPYDIEAETSLVIPVLTVESDNRDEAVEKVYSTYLAHQDFTKYAIAGNSLKFYEITPKEHGKEIGFTGNYKRTGTRNFFRLARGTKLAREVMEKIRVIEKRYHAAS